ncbi:MAG: hypothetical protein IJS89_03315 [Bacteroidaceae bacterium]|nr:hypothetical protein [Bacteroidaceae bacterium]
MYNEQIEALISAALADGVLTDKERQVLLKRAKAEGIDADEFEMVLDARLVEMQKTQAAAPPPPAPPAPQPFVNNPAPMQPQPKSHKYGEVRKCPQCGAVVEGGAARCESCGYAFVGVEAVSSAQALAKKLANIDYWYKRKEEEHEQVKRGRSALRNAFDLHEQEPLDSQRAKAIKDFPIPNTREDLMEFVITMRSKWKNTSSDYESERMAYKAKYQECLQKVKFLFADDPAFQEVIKQEKNDKGLFTFLKDNPTIAAAAGFAGIMLFLFLMAALL